MTNEQNIKAILECFFSGYKEEIIDSATTRILETIEGVPVRHGKWVQANPMVDTLMCSECGYNILSEELISNYCPDCGAKMDGERRTDERVD